LDTRGSSDCPYFEHRSILDSCESSNSRSDVQCLEKDRNLRFQHAADMRADLQRLKRDLDTSRSAISSARETQGDSGASRVPSMAEATASGRATASDSEIAVGLVARHKKTFVAMAATALLVAAALGFGTYRWLASHSGSSIESLAVLPFANVTADPNAE
jgi:eukaryotic-like serine/threonine-protein kinase